MAAQIVEIAGQLSALTYELPCLGLHAYSRAARELDALERHYGFVRSMEAILRPRNRTEFTQRLNEFIRGCTRTCVRFDEIYRLRNVAAHFLDWQGQVLCNTAKAKQAKLVDRYSAWTEVLASEFWKVILSRQNLLHQFQIRRDARGFWLLPVKDRQAIIGEPLQIGSAILARRWRPPLRLQMPQGGSDSR